MATEATIYHPRFGGQVRATFEPRPDSDEQATAQTIARMAQYAREDSANALVRQAAHDARKSSASADPAAAVFEWIRAHVRFVQDADFARGLCGAPEEAEVLIRPVDLLTMPDPAGDCDDFSMLAASMLRALGIESAYKTVAADASDPSRYSHVYVIARQPGGDLALDCSHGRFPGWEVATAGKTRLWPIEETTRMRSNLHGLEAIDWGSIIQTGVTGTADILKARYATPQLQPGTYLQQGNTVQYRQDPNASPLTFPGTSLGLGDSSSLLLIVGAVVVLLVVTSMGRSR